MYAIITPIALLASSALAGSVGAGRVVNNCNYNVTLQNTPAVGGGYDQINRTLSFGQTYTHPWTELTNRFGWAIKLGKDPSMSSILQYEYTYHKDDPRIWFDVSEVNGNPWGADWKFTAEPGSSACSPKQRAYRYDHDDLNGMQDCSADAVITLTVCSGNKENDAGAASASSSVDASTSTSTSSSTSSVPTHNDSELKEASNTPASATSLPTHNLMESDEETSSPAPTTFATFTSSSAVVSTGAGRVTVTEIETAVVTEVVTYTQWHGHAHRKRAPTGARHRHR